MRDVWIAGILSLIYPGIGQIYSGKRRRGILFIVSELLVTGLNAFLNGTLDLLFYGIMLGAFVDAIRVASKSKNSNTPTFLRGKKLILEVGLAILLSLSLMYVSQLAGEWSLFQVMFPQKTNEELSEAKAKAKKYLEDKYEKQFRITGGKYVSNAGNFYIDASPIENQIDFTVTADETMSRFSDTYANTVWTNESKEQVEPIVENIFRGDEYFLESTIGFDETLQAEIRGNVPSLEEMKESYPDQYLHSVKVYIIKDIQGNKREEAQRIFDLLSQLDQQDNRYSLEVVYFNPEIKEKHVKDINTNNEDKYLSYEQFVFSPLSISEVKEIRSPEDVEAKIRDIRK